MEDQSQNCQVCCESSSRANKPRLKKASNIRPYKCGICLRGFPKLASLTKHVKLQHFGEKPLKCPLCSESFQQSSLLNAHLATHLGSNTSSYPENDVIATSGPIELVNCSNMEVIAEVPEQISSCHNSVSITALRSRFLPNNEEKANSNLSPMFSTSESNRMSNSLPLTAQSKPYKCEVCLKSFTKASVLANHVKIHKKGKPFKCHICNKIFTESGNLTRHVRTHLGGRVFNCNICHKVFSQSSNLTTHKRIHSGERPFQCFVCDKAFTESGNLRRHMRTHSGEKPFKCDICQKPFSQASHVVKHKSTHFQIKHFKSKIRNRKTRRKAKSNIGGNASTNSRSGRPGLSGRRRQTVLNVIKIRSPSGKTWYKCAICEKVFKESGNLTRHLRTHTGERPFHCSICYKAFSQASHVHKHMKTHRPVEQLPCEICLKSFPNFDGLYEHMKIHSGLDTVDSKCTILKPANLEETTVATAIALHESEAQADQIRPPLTPPPASPPRYTIRIQAFSKPFQDGVGGDPNRDSSENQYMILEPIAKQLPSNNLATTATTIEVPSRLSHSPPSSVYECDICQKTFSRYCFLTKHKRIHLKLKPYKCVTCGKGFTESGNLSRHMRVHSGERPYKCSVCMKAFSQSTHVRKHMNTHAAGKPFICHLCQKTFTKATSLTKHMKSHSRDKTFHCHICDKIFSESGNLSRHLRIHSGLRPYQCNVCHKSFFQSCVLNKHKRIHLENKPFKCDLCRKSFTESGNLTRHLRTHTGERPYHCKICNKAFSQASHVTKHMRTHSTGAQPYQYNFDSYGATFLPAADSLYSNSLSLIDDVMAATAAAAAAAATGQDASSIIPNSLAAQYNNISRNVRFFAGSELCECTNCNRSFTVPQYTEHITACLAATGNNGDDNTMTSKANLDIKPAEIKDFVYDQQTIPFGGYSSVFAQSKSISDLMNTYCAEQSNNTQTSIKTEVV